MEDYKLSPEIAHHCASAIHDSCANGIERGGKTLHCLMSLAPKGELKSHPECEHYIYELLEEARPADDITLDPAMAKTCRVMIRKCRDLRNVENEE